MRRITSRFDLGKKNGVSRTLEETTKLSSFNRVAVFFITKSLNGKAALFSVSKLFRATVEPRYNGGPSRGLAMYSIKNTSCVCKLQRKQSGLHSLLINFEPWGARRGPSLYRDLLNRGSTLVAHWGSVYT